MPQADESVWGKPCWAIHGTQELSSTLLPRLCISKSTSCRRVSLGSQNSFRVTKLNIRQELAPRCISPAAAHPGSRSPLPPLLRPPPRPPLTTEGDDVAAVLVDKLSGNSLLHDLLHLQDAQGWKRLMRWGAVPRAHAVPPECAQAPHLTSFARRLVTFLRCHTKCPTSHTVPRTAPV